MILAGKIIDKQLSERLIYQYSILAPNGQILSPAYVMGGGGSAKNFVNTPYEVGADVLVATSNPRGHAPYFILGGMQDPSDQQRINIQVPEVSGATVASVNEGDYAVRLGNAVLMLTANGNCVSAGLNINQQLSGGVFRVSQGGLAENQLLNAQSTIDTLINYISVLNIKIAALSQAVNTSATAVQAAYTAAAAAATAAGDLVLAQQLAQSSADNVAAVAALNATAPLPDAATMNTSLLNSVNPHISVP
jgi:hypothetical protein